MIALPTNTDIFLYTHPTDMRKSFCGLSGIVRNVLGREPNDGSLFLFINRNKDKLKALYWDRDGLAVWYKTQTTEHPRFKVFTEVPGTNSFSVFAASACDMD